MLALAEYRSQICDCGGHMPETMDPANDGMYTPRGPYLCFRCEAIGSARKAFIADRPEVANPFRWSADLRR